jgi:DNA repair protein REV1
MLRYTAAVQPLSCDEAYLDLTGLGEPDALVAALRADIVAATGCTASAGARALRRRRASCSATAVAQRFVGRRFLCRHGTSHPLPSFSLTHKAGIGPNLLLARIATGRAKPNGQLRVRPGAEALAFLDELRVSAIPGIGYATAEKLEEKLGITQARASAARGARVAVCGGCRGEGGGGARRCSARQPA